MTDEFKTKLDTARNNTIAALNKNQDSLYDIFFKVIAIPNVIIILAASYPHIEDLIKEYYFLRLAYLMTVYSYLATLFFYICGFSCRFLDDNYLSNIKL